MSLDVFQELSEYVLLADLEVIYGARFAAKHGDAIVAKFGAWVQNMSASVEQRGGQLLSLVRDPVDRAVSMLHEMVRRGWMRLPAARRRPHHGREVRSSRPGRLSTRRGLTCGCLTAASLTCSAVA